MLFDQSPFTQTSSTSGRYRNSRFSLAQVEIPGYTPRATHETWTMQRHEDFVREKHTRVLSPGASVVLEPEFYHTSRFDSTLNLEKQVFRYMVDLNMDPRSTSRHRRIEWPTLNPTILPHLAGGPLTQRPASALAPIPEAAAAVVQKEISKCDFKQVIIADLNIYDEASIRIPHLESILRNLWWRGRRQSAIWVLFQILVARGFIDSACLQRPVDLLRRTPSTSLVTGLLGCFSGVHTGVSLAFDDKISLQSVEWAADVQWLATMIVRTGMELDNLFDTIAATKILGQCDEEILALYRLMYPIAELPAEGRENEREGTLLPSGEVPPSRNLFAFWLPHGVSANDEARNTQISSCLARFDAIEKAYRQTEEIPENDPVFTADPEEGNRTGA